MIKIFNRALLAVVVLIVLLGFVLPALVSHASLELPLLAALIILGVLYFTGYSIIKLIEKKTHENPE